METIIYVVFVVIVAVGYWVEKNIEKGNHIYHKYRDYVQSETRMNYQDVLNVMSGSYNVNIYRESYSYYEHKWGFKPKKKSVLATEMYFRYSHWLLHGYVQNITMFPELYPMFLRKRKYKKFGYNVQKFIKKYGHGDRKKAEFILYRALTWCNYIVNISYKWDEEWLREHEDDEDKMDDYYYYLELKRYILSESIEIIDTLCDGLAHNIYEF